MPPELVVHRDRLDSVLPLLGAEVNDDGYLVDTETGEVVRSEDGEELTIDEIGYLGHGSIEPVEADFSAVVSRVSDENLWDD
ncbi:hypothetical protein [Halobaculum sp. MBLA0143]|uniref:hypothetical protein n=1 Tax=Halobaculum sp. MBLA0143 TaxID=3079933 RepID=UPI003523467C